MKRHESLYDNYNTGKKCSLLQNDLFNQFKTIIYTVQNFDLLNSNFQLTFILQSNLY
jgi:hypothetical protein